METEYAIAQILGPILESSIRILQALATPVIAAAGVYIGYQQKRQGDIRLQIERFDKRYAIYAGAKDLLANISTEGTFKTPMLFPFLRTTGDAVFLTNDDIVKYLDELRIKAIRLGSLRGSETAEEESELLTWFFGQYSVLQEKFRPLLSYDA